MLAAARYASAGRARDTLCACRANINYFAPLLHSGRIYVWEFKEPCFFSVAVSGQRWGGRNTCSARTTGAFATLHSTFFVYKNLKNDCDSSVALKSLFFYALYFFLPLQRDEHEHFFLNCLFTPAPQRRWCQKAGFCRYDLHRLTHVQVSTWTAFPLSASAASLILHWPGFDMINSDDCVISLYPCSERKESITQMLNLSHDNI